MVYEELEKQVNEIKEEFGRHMAWKSKLVGAIFSFGVGAGLGAIGKHTGEEYIPAIPIGLDIFGSCAGIGAWIPYGAGVAMNYLPEIYSAMQNLNSVGG